MNALTSVDRLRSAGYGGTASDDSLALAINAVSASFERFCDRKFRLQKFTATPDEAAGDLPPEWVAGTGRRLLLVSCYPIQSVESICVGGLEVENWRLDPVEAEFGAISAVAGVWPASGDCSPNIQVSYLGGFSEVPADLELAALREINLAVCGGDAAQVVKSERTPGGWGVTYGGHSQAFSLETCRVLKSYRRQIV